MDVQSSRLRRSFPSGSRLLPQITSNLAFSETLLVLAIRSPPSSDFYKTRHFSTFLDISRHFSTFLDASLMHEKCRSHRWEPAKNGSSQPKTPSPPTSPKHLQTPPPSPKQLQTPPPSPKHLQTPPLDRQSEISKTRHFSTLLDFSRQTIQNFQNSTFLDITRHFSTLLDITRHFSTFLDASQTHEICRSRYWGGPAIDRAPTGSSSGSILTSFHIAICL